MDNGERTIPLLPAQEGLLFAEQAHGYPGSHNLALALRLTGPLDGEAVRAAVGALVSRHQALRVSFRQHGTVTVQHIATTAPAEVAELDLTSRGASGRPLDQHLTAAQRQPFALDRAP